MITCNVTCLIEDKINIHFHVIYDVCFRLHIISVVFILCTNINNNCAQQMVQ